MFHRKNRYANEIIRYVRGEFFVSFESFSMYRTISR